MPFVRHLFRLDHVLRGVGTRYMRGCLWVGCLMATLLICAEGMGAEPVARELVVEANKALAAGRYDEAIKGYEKASQTLTDSPELAYDQGVAYYRKGELAKAAELFTKALSTRDPSLEGKAKFNLGNCAYAEALQKQADVEAALERLRMAVAHYKDAIAMDSEDMDAHVNRETAQLFMKELLDKQKQKQEQQQEKNEEGEDNPTSQPESQPASQPSDQDQPQQDQEKGDQQQQDQQQGESKEGDKKKGQQEDKSKDGGKLDKNEKGNDEQASQQAGRVEPREMSKEEAEKLLQAVRDKERQRRAQKARLMRVRRVPVEKDW